MKSLFSVALLVLGSVLASAYSEEVPPWQPPAPGAFRGPCPMMNTLANHGYLPRDGDNITRQVVIDAMGDALNFDSELAVIMFDQAVIANPEPNATFFTLYGLPTSDAALHLCGIPDALGLCTDYELSVRDHLNQHNVLEHDASLSRTDAFFGNNHIFNQTVFDETRSYWSGSVVTANMLASSKLARQVSSKAFNPTYKFTTHTEEFSLGEVAAPVIAFGDLEAVTVPRDLIEYFFMNERLPSELGWTRKTDVVTLETITDAVNAIRNASTLFTSDDSGLVARRLRSGLHGGARFH